MTKLLSASLKHSLSIPGFLSQFQGTKSRRKSLSSRLDFRRADALVWYFLDALIISFLFFPPTTTTLTDNSPCKPWQKFSGELLKFHLICTLQGWRTVNYNRICHLDLHVIQWLSIPHGQILDIQIHKAMGLQKCKWYRLNIKIV